MNVRLQGHSREEAEAAQKTSLFQLHMFVVCKADPCAVGLHDPCARGLRDPCARGLRQRPAPEACAIPAPEACPGAGLGFAALHRHTLPTAHVCRLQGR